MIHDNTIIEDNVRIYQNVTLGRADVYKSEKDSPSEFKGFLLKEGACICAGAKLICKKGTLVIGKNAVVGANAVLLIRLETMKFGAVFQQDLLECARQVTTKCKISNGNCNGGRK